MLDKLAIAANNPWYTLPKYMPSAADATELIKSIAQYGIAGTSITTTTFKKWCKAAKVPNWNMVKKDTAQSIAKLFFPGVTKWEHDVAIDYLTSLKKATLKNKSKKASVKLTAVPPPSPDALTVSQVATPIPVSITSEESFHELQMLDLSLLKSTGKGAPGSSKPTEVLALPNGKKVLFKKAPYGSGEDWRSDVDVAAYKLAEVVKGNNIPIRKVTIDGEVGSLQWYDEGASTPNTDPSTLSPVDMGELLSQHMLDMFMGDHDGNVTNWIRTTDGVLTAVDRGQAFKPLFMKAEGHSGWEDSYSPEFHLKGNYGAGYAKELLKQWGDGEAAIPNGAIIAMRKVMDSIAALTDGQLEMLMEPIFESKGSSKTVRKKVLSMLRSRRKSFVKAWTETLQMLRADFTWPDVHDDAFIPLPDPKEQFGKDLSTVKKTVADAVKAGPQGKALKMDSKDVEGQEVMVFDVDLKLGVKSTPATMIQFRLSKDAAIRAGLNFVKLAGKPSNVPTANHPGQLQVDISNSIWIQIQKAFRSLNYHFMPKGSTPVAGSSSNPVGDFKVADTATTSLKWAKSYLSTVKESVDSAEAKSKSDIYGDPISAVKAMLSLYTKYTTSIDKVIKNAKKYEDKSLTYVPMTYEPFIYEPPAPKKGSGEKPSIPYKIKINVGAMWPSTSVDHGRMVVSNFKNPMHASSSHVQYVTEDPSSKGMLFFNVPGGEKGGAGGSGHSSEESTPGFTAGFLSGVESSKSICWGVVPVPPSPSAVATLFRMFEIVSTVKMPPATKEDQEVLYWSRQAYLLQATPEGALKPNPDGTGVKNVQYKAALDAYGSGDSSTALKTLKKFVAKRVGMSVKEVEKIADAPTTYDSGGAGRTRSLRIGWTRDRMIKELPADVFPVHKLTQVSSHDDLGDYFLEKLGKSGMLIAAAARPFHGADKGGASSSTDFSSGGAHNVFGVFRKFKQAGSVIIYLDPSVLLRTDVIVTGGSDNFGDIVAPRYTRPEAWASWCKNHSGALTSGVGAGSSYQITFRNDIDLRTYMYGLACGNKTNVASVKKAFAQLGWTSFAQGRTVDQVVFV